MGADAVRSGVIVSIQVGKPQIRQWEDKEWISAIAKHQVEGEVLLRKLNFEGDVQGDLENHGGPDKAVCVYCVEHYAHWEKVLGGVLGKAAFGENLTVRGLTEEAVCIGDKFRMGSAIVQISQPRQPCYKLGYKHGRPDLPMLVQNMGYTGYYFRVLEEGIVKPGDALELLERSPYGVTVAYANQIKYRERDNLEGARLLLQVPELSESWRQSLSARFERPLEM